MKRNRISTPSTTVSINFKVLYKIALIITRVYFSSWLFSDVVTINFWMELYQKLNNICCYICPEYAPWYKLVCTLYTFPFLPRSFAHSLTLFLTHTLSMLHVFLLRKKKIQRMATDCCLMKKRRKKNAVCWSSDEEKQQNTYKSNIHHGNGRQTAWLSMFYFCRCWFFFFIFTPLMRS